MGLDNYSVEGEGGARMGEKKRKKSLHKHECNYILYCIGFTNKGH